MYYHLIKMDSLFKNLFNYGKMRKCIGHFLFCGIAVCNVYFYEKRKAGCYYESDL